MTEMYIFASYMQVTCLTVRILETAIESFVLGQHRCKFNVHETETETEGSV